MQVQINYDCHCVGLEGIARGDVDMLGSCVNRVPLT